MTKLSDPSNEKHLIERFEAQKELLIQAYNKIHRTLDQLKQTQDRLTESEKARIKNLEQSGQELNQKNDLLSDQNKELEHFAYIVSHDLKAPLRGIERLANFIEQDLKDDRLPSAYSYLDTLKNRVSRMEGLIKGILDFSKIGMVKSVKENVDLNDLINDEFDLLKVEGFELNITASLPFLLGVRIQLVQLFSNLISNAIKFNDKEQGLLEIGYQKIENGHEFSVKDNGPGIAVEHQEKIFVAFQTLNTRDTFESTGIGLSITKKIVSKMGGMIRIESKPNEGTNFIIWLPTNEPLEQGLGT